jgi:hypothetical protein
MVPGGVALACGRGGKSWRIELPPHCNNPKCRKANDEQVIKDAIERGVIDP